ncbi:MAG: CinA family protein [Spiroplasma sp.]
METIINMLKELNYTLSTCESITGGLFSKLITDIPGASQVFKGGVVAYTDEIKVKVVKIKKEILEKYGAVSPECALAMSQNVRKIFKTNVAISFTGNAGPDGSETKPVGLVYLAIVFEKYFLIEKLILKDSRQNIRNKVVKQAQKILIKNLIKIKKELPK